MKLFNFVDTSESRPGGGPPVINRHCNKHRSEVKEHYRIQMNLTIEGSCRLNGQEKAAQLLADIWEDARRGKYPSGFNTFQNRMYYFYFKTSENCVLKGKFTYINLYKA
ncbi:hypothetical protein PIROE2DRAFT_16895 [Piromyces sp. E2]|nr:hypothetical protein PIROE2DRAFT_16895 [Piromyces sp. E2]|eukprot:OUM57957.1 hypothetical protein PIROE2DRAFT_16895 [Piromyces sp. E2]